MQYIIVAVGRWKLSSEQILYEKFNVRINPILQLKEVEEKRPFKKAELTRREGKLLLSAVPERALVVALDGNGQNLTSNQFAAKLISWRDKGVRTVTFLIGGAGGHDSEVLERADLVLSLGAQTWPHLMVRVMLAEQLYRAQSIILGHPYHRE